MKQMPCSTSTGHHGPCSGNDGAQEQSHTYKMTHPKSGQNDFVPSDVVGVEQGFLIRLSDTQE